MERNTSKESTSERGQAYTLEAFTASFILLLAVLFAIQSSAVTPLTDSTASKQIESQQGDIAQGVLETTKETGELKKMVLYWNTTEEKYHNSGETGVYDGRNAINLSDGLPNNGFGETIDTFMLDEGVAANVQVVYYTENTDGTFSQERRDLINMGSPSENAYTASKTFPLFDDDEFIAENNSSDEQTLKDQENQFYIKDIDDSSSTYNLVRVEIIVWKI